MNSPKPLTWEDRVRNLTEALGRRPTLKELLLLAPLHNMTPEEREAQQESFVRGMRRTGDPRFD